MTPIPAERNLGPQPLAALMEREGIGTHDLVAAGDGRVTFKMVARAAKGRRLTPHSQNLILAALDRHTGRPHRMSELFNY